MTISLTRETLAEALARAGRGDRAAFREVYDATSAKLMGVTLRILRDRQLAEDVLQDAYLTVWNKAATFDAARASPITWLVTIARNRAIDRLRSSAVRRTSDGIDAAAEIADDGPTPAEATERRDEARRLGDCLGELDVKTAAAIREAFFDGATYDALAQAAGTPLGTMKSWIRRGLLKLRTCLDQ